MMNDQQFAEWEASIKRMYGVVLSIAADPQTAHGMAQMYRQLYDALIEAGFAPAEALVITAGNRQMPQANPS